MNSLFKTLNQWALLVLITPLLGSCDANVKTWKSYHTEIPGYVIEFKIPPELVLGYSEYKRELLFINPKSNREITWLGTDAYWENICRFYHGAVGDFSDWDSNIDFDLFRFTDQSLMDSGNKLLKFFQGRYSEPVKLLLKDGKEYTYSSSVALETISKKDVVVVTKNNQFKTVKLELSDGFHSEITPSQYYYVRLNDEFTLGIRIDFENDKKLNPKWYANYRTMIDGIIGSITITQK